ncbi:MAG: hypothetical protein WCC64_15485 [Aliidongia sp.]
MASLALVKFRTMNVGTAVLRSYAGSPSAACRDQHFIDQTCLKGAIAFTVGCWEGYIEAALREFVSKVRVQAHRRAWTLIAQFEAIVDKRATDLNTPNWDKTRELLVEITGMDPYTSWTWTPKFTNPADTKIFFDGVMSVRHAFAHGFEIPTNIPGNPLIGALEINYVEDAIRCVEFFAETTDHLLGHELSHRHNCASGWS